MNTIETKLSILITGLLCSVSGNFVYAEESYKSGYHLFSPTPRHLMRELSTDRPDKTESPYTVDAGHFQVEMDAISFSFDNENGLTRRTADVMTTNIKIGLTNSHDLQVVLPVLTGESQEIDNPPSAELFTDLREDISPISTFDLGITLGVSSSLQLDTGMNIGLSSAADDFNPFLGASVRF